MKKFYFFILVMLFFSSLSFSQEKEIFKVKEKIKKYDCEIGINKGNNDVPIYKIKNGLAEFSLTLNTKKKLKYRKDKNKHKFESFDIEAEYENILDNDGTNKLKETIIFKKKLKTNKIIFIIKSKGLVFYKQNKLTKQEIKDGCIRPDNVVNSYAIYYKVRDYSNTGKFGHLYRPFVKDSTGLFYWCDMNIVNDQLIIDIPKEFLNKAKYPVTLDPTIGYTTLGASGALVSANNRVHCIEYAQAPEDITITKITIGFYVLSGSAKVKAGLYATASETSLPSSLYGVTSDEAIITNKSATWYDLTANISINKDNYFIFAFNSGTDGGTNRPLMAYDSIGSRRTWMDYDVTYPNFSDPFVNSSLSYSSKKPSFYVTYGEETAVVKSQIIQF